jgi:cytochrome c oxidase cbb3-type subunit I/II
MDPRQTSDKSIMPPYPWLMEQQIDTSLTPKMIRIMTTLGVPYEDGYDKIANEDLMKQANEIVDNLAKEDIDAYPRDEIIALIAYLQRLGRDIYAEEETAVNK